MNKTIQNNQQTNQSANLLQDSFGRKFPYLRLSITDICNFSCQYCLPNGYQCNHKKSFLTLVEIQRLIDAFAEMGVSKIRITGGEPTIRKDFLEIAKIISSHPLINKVALSTNGYRLKNAQKWWDAGIRYLNISIDSLNSQNFYQITGHNRLKEILLGIENAINIGFKIKINAVLLKTVNDGQLADYLNWIKNLPICVRFIELMQTKDNGPYFERYHISADKIRNTLLNDGWQIKPRSFDAGPAEEFSHPNYLGTFGIIAPYAKDFCKNCNRLRVSSKGDLHLCLFGNNGTPLRHLLQLDEQKPILKELIHKQLNYKKSSHFLAFGDSGSTFNLAQIGG